MKYFLMYLLFGIISVLCFLFCLKISEWYKDYITMRVRNRIGWWVIDDASKVFSYMQRTCKKLNIEEKYLINSEVEKKIAFEIIDIYQQHSKDWYLSCSDNFKLAIMPYNDFFMYYFEKFLSEQNGRYFNESKMYIEISRERFENGSYESKCSITEYGVVYNKLHYMTHLYCERSSKLNKNNNFYSAGIKEILDKQQITFWHHHW